MRQAAVLTRSRQVILFLAYSLLFFSLAPASGVFGQRDCAQLLKELKAAQATWQEAFEDWTNKSARAANAARRSQDINSQLKKLFDETVKAEAEADECARAAKDPTLAPLFDCAKVPQRVRDLKAESARLEQELREIEKETEKLEEESAAAHEAEKKAAAALDATRQAYAKCGEFWVGRITRRTIRSEEPSTSTVTKMVAGDPSTEIVSKESSREELIQIDILPDPPLPGETSPITSVVRRFVDHDYKRIITEGVMVCRGKGIPTHKERIRNEYLNRSDNEGSATTNEVVLIDFNNEGYSIRTWFPKITIMGRSEIRRTNVWCPTSKPDTVTVNESSKTLPIGDIWITGRVNPKSPDILKGSETTGDLKTSLTTLTWELRRIKGKKK